jgi:hypothetical protein
MTGQTKRPAKKFERKSGAMPTLKRAAPQAATPSESDTADTSQLAEASVPGFLSQKEVLLRLVETLKSL